LVAEPVGEPGAKPTHLPTTDVLGHVREGHTMRKTKVLAGMAAGLMLIGGAAFAGSIISFSPTGLNEVPEFPHVQDVSVTFTYEGDEGLCVNANGTTWAFWVEDEDKTVLASDTGRYLKSDPPGPVCLVSESETETLEEVEFPEAGSYWLKATLKTNQGKDVDEADEAEVVFELEQEFIVTYPAAPSVAAKLLADADVKARYGSGKAGGNYIADVAAEMGPGTDFREVKKSSTSAYRAEVRAFLVESGALTN
jgi:hypothetical protein